MEECPPDKLPAFLMKLKDEGYALVGLEQTMSSKMLGKVELPKKMALVLGEEKEGIPANIIQVAVEICVECSCLICASKFRSTVSFAR